MEFELVKLAGFSNDEVSVYTLLNCDTGISLFQSFIQENQHQFPDEVKDIAKRILSFKEVGARENFFKINEGKPGDGVCALYDDEKSNLRLYCIRYGTVLVVLGSGGHKPKTTRRLQETKKLEDENQIMRNLSAEIEKRRRNGDLSFSKDFLEIDGDLIFNL
jgi:putative component of toxin-antitoxin plasmid stabilization module